MSADRPLAIMSSTSRFDASFEFDGAGLASVRLRSGTAPDCRPPGVVQYPAAAASALVIMVDTCRRA